MQKTFSSSDSNAPSRRELLLLAAGAFSTTVAGAPAAEINPPEIMQATNLSLSVGTPVHSAASSSSRRIPVSASPSAPSPRPRHARALPLAADKEGNADRTLA